MDKSDGFETGAIEVPDFLDDEAIAEWTRIVPQLRGAGLLRLVDRSALTAYCQSWSTFVGASKELKANGSNFVSVERTTSKGEKLEPCLEPHPAIKVIKEANLRMKMYMEALGLTPAARKRLKSAEAAPPEDVDELINGQE